MVPKRGWATCGHPLRIAVLTTLFFGYGLSIAHAQNMQTITPDGTAGTKVKLNDNTSTYEITRGHLANSNLFHSFEKFGLNKDFTADFQDPGGNISNIIARVTGGDVSSIDGKLKAFTNLYLINPAGLIFGRNATLDINGSFYASTADRVVFADNSYLSVADIAGSTFTMADPAKFGFLGDNPPANKLPENKLPENIVIEESVLIVPPGERLALVGGDLTIESNKKSGQPGERFEWR